MSGDVSDRVSSLRAIAHPVRLQILSLLTGTAMSAAEVAREMDISHANASYHLRVLAKAGQLVPAGEQKVRGGVAKRYRHPWETGPSSGQQTPAPEDFIRHVRAVADELTRRSTQRRPGGRNILTDAEMWVSPEAWAQVIDLVAQASRLVHAEARPPRTQGTVHVNLTAVAFEMGEEE